MTQPPELKLSPIGRSVRIDQDFKDELISVTVISNYGNSENEIYEDRAVTFKIKDSTNLQGTTAINQMIAMLQSLIQVIPQQEVVSSTPMNIPISEMAVSDDETQTRIQEALS